MTTEDDFQAAPDASPDDWQTRLVFAAWLQERIISVCAKTNAVRSSGVQLARSRRSRTRHIIPDGPKTRHRATFEWGRG